MVHVLYFRPFPQVKSRKRKENKNHLWNDVRYQIDKSNLHACMHGKAKPAGQGFYRVSASPWKKDASKKDIDRASQPCRAKRPP